MKSAALHLRCLIGPNYIFGDTLGAKESLNCA